MTRCVGRAPACAGATPWTSFFHPEQSRFHSNVALPSDFFECALDRSLAYAVGEHHDRHAASFKTVIRLINTRKRDAKLAQDSRKARQDAGAIGDRKAQVKAGFHIR